MFTLKRPLYVLYMFFPTYTHSLSPYNPSPLIICLGKAHSSPQISLLIQTQISASRPRAHTLLPALDSVWAVTGIRLPCRKWTAGTNDNPSLLSFTLLEQNLHLIKNWLILICWGVWSDDVWVRERLVYFYFCFLWYVWYLWVLNVALMIV